jgi:hypothetical protein
MSPLVSLRVEPSYAASRWGGAFAAARRGLRRAMGVLAVLGGGVLMIAGLVLAVLPGHLGVPVLAVGLILVLRNSRRARRSFIVLQRRHPRFVFPVRRLIRREPEVFPVLWQQVLRFERMVFPNRLRRAGRWRRKYLRARRPLSPDV